MQFKKYTKQRNSIQGLRSFKDTLPKNVKKVINKKGHVYSETINNWRYLVGESLFNYCYPKSFKSSNKFHVSTLLINVKRGHEVDMEYSKNDIIDRINNFFGYSVVEKIKLKSFENNKKDSVDFIDKSNHVTNEQYKKKIDNIKNKEIKNSLLELSKVFKEK